jgi:hypothetical protein
LALFSRGLTRGAKNLCIAEPRNKLLELDTVECSALAGVSVPPGSDWAARPILRGFPDGVE